MISAILVFQLGQARWRDPVDDAGWPELRRVLEDQGGVYVEVPAATAASPPVSPGS